MKNLFLGALICLVTFTASAQEKKMTLGIKAGANISSLSDINSKSYYSESGNGPAEVTYEKLKGKSLTSFHVGLYFHIPVSRLVSIQPEIFYSEEGSKINREGYSGTYEKSYIHTNYIQVPVLASIKLLQNLNFVAGPQFSFLLNSKSHIGYSYRSNQSGSWVNITSEESGALNKARGTNISLTAGLNYLIAGHFDIYGRYNIGMKSIVKDSERSNNRNLTAQLGVGYRF